MVDIYRPMHRQGPGSRAATVRALEIAGLGGEKGLRIADIGCGTGASSVILAQLLEADVVAVDFLPPLLDELMIRASQEGLADQITTIEASMEQLPFTDGEFDVLWSEGAIYNMGFREGVQAWLRFLKPGGVLVVSEITWTTAERPREIDEFWMQEYPQIDVASAKIEVLEQAGYSPQGYFVLPEDCWTMEFYGPLEERLADVEQQHGSLPEVQQLVAAQRAEIDLYRRYGQYFGYGMYVARMLGSDKGGRIPESRGGAGPF